MEGLKGKNRFRAMCLGLLLAALLPGCAGGQRDEAPERETPERGTPQPGLRISEVMADNRAFLMDEQGNFPDWIELHNAGSRTVELGGYTLSDGSHSWPLPEGQLAAGEYLLLYCGQEEDSGRVSFSLSAKGEELSLWDAAGEQCQSFCFGASQADESWLAGEDGQARACALPSPGFANDEVGYQAAMAQRRTPELAINEVMCFNRLYPSQDKQYYDQIELRNNSDHNILLSEYYLSDSRKELLAWQLPARTLAPGELAVIPCDEGVPFALNSLREQLYLTHEEGEIRDCVSLHGLPANGSFGRMPEQQGFFYFRHSSMGRENSGGAMLISRRPEALTQDGVFEGVDSISLELQAEGEIYYTLDGSRPTAASERYTGPITLTATTVVRAVSLEPGKLESDSLDLSYIINEGHSLPVASVVADPEDLFGERGLYSNPTEDYERPGSIAFFNGEERFRKDCGVKLHGATSRVKQEKKSLKLNFRDAYDGTLEYDLFQNGVTAFDSVLLRAAQEGSFSTNMRDVIMHELAKQCCPELPRQDYTYTVLYINGQYWGIYAFREAHSAEHFARHNGLDPDQVTMWHKRWAEDGPFEDVARFILTEDMSIDENYDYAMAHLDMDNLAAWAIIQSYSGNFDINSPNVRFYYDAGSEKLYFALVDLDLGLYVGGEFANAFKTGYIYSDLLLSLADNPRFTQAMAERLLCYLNGPLSEENVLSVIDSLEQQLLPEAARDGERWGFTLKQWERDIDEFIRYVVTNRGQGDYCWQFARSAAGILGLNQEQLQQSFGQLPH